MCFLSWFDQCFDRLLRQLWPLTHDVWALCVQVIRKGEVSCCWICTTCKDNEYVQDEFTCKACELGWWPDNDLAGRREKKLWAHLLLFFYFCFYEAYPSLFSVSYLVTNQRSYFTHVMYLLLADTHLFCSLVRTLQSQTLAFKHHHVQMSQLDTSFCMMLYITRSHDSALLALSTSTPLPPKVTLLTSLLPALCLVVPQWLFWQRFIELRGALSSQV